MLLLVAPLGGSAASDAPPFGLKPEQFRKLMEDREILVSADLEDGNYSYYAAMLVKASHALTRKTLTDYQVYSQLISYIDKAEWNEKTRLLRIEGGIWTFKLQSTVHFTEKSDRHIQYRIVAGHFAGLAGDILFEPQGEKGTAVYFRGEKRGGNWPPAFVIERGAEIVFGFTARKMRSYVESLKTQTPSEEKKDGDHSLPRPRPRI